MNRPWTSTCIANCLPWVILAVTTAGLQFGAAYPELRLELPASPLPWLYTSLTCHLVHVTTRHWLTDLVALAVIAFIFYNTFTWRSWLLTYVLSAFSISAGLSLFPHDMHSYAGLSGLLHGYFAMGCLLLFPRQPRLASVLGSLLLVKLLVGQFYGSSFLVYPGFEVAHGAHIYGVLGGVLSWFAVYIYRSLRGA